jgi:hypothetical protein
MRVVKYGRNLVDMGRGYWWAEPPAYPELDEYSASELGGNLPQLGSPDP